MKVTVKFGNTGVVVPCKDGWMVRDLIHQATQRYKKIVDQDGEFLVRTHHVEYTDGGVLDPDDLLTDLVEDKDKLVAVFDETVSPGGSVVSGRSSPDLPEPEIGGLQPPSCSEIDVTSFTLKSATPLLVRSSSDPALAPPPDVFSLDTEESGRPPLTEVGHAETLKGGAVDKHKVLVSDTRPGQINMSGLTRTVEVSGETGPLGIKVVPYSSSLSGRSLGLHIRSVDENSRSLREGLFKEDECIVRINDVELIDKSFAQSQEVFRQAMFSSKVCLEVLPVDNRLRYEKSLIGQLFTNTEPNPAQTRSPFLIRKLSSNNAATPSSEPTVSQTLPLNEEERLPPRHTPVQAEPRKDTPSPLTNAAPTLKDRTEGSVPKRTTSLAMLVNMMNKKYGKNMRINLKKGAEGLGFTVVTRDSSLHGPGPILVKSILHRGAAVKDGRLRSGDRILEVNGVDITRRTQEELVTMLRNTRLGDTVSMIVSRQEKLLPRKQNGELSTQVRSEDGGQQLQFEVPLNDSGSAGLGVSLKGNKSLETGEDLGIFIKSITPGGAAHQDGRLHVNDQLIAVNSESLLGRSNHDAMETLQRSMFPDRNLRGTIQLVVLRGLERSPAQENQEVSQTPVRKDAPVQQPNSDQTNICAPPLTQSSRVSEVSPDLHTASYRSYVRRQDLPEEDEDDSEDDLPPPPSEEDLIEASSPRKHPPQWGEMESVTPMSHQFNHQHPQRQRPSHYPTMNTTKSFNSEPLSSNGSALGPRLGLQRSSSFESLQMTIEEVSKEEVSFHRPPKHMLRGRGCNLSFRYAIDKSYDRSSEPEDDNSEEDSRSDVSTSSFSPQHLEDDRKMKKTKKSEKKTKKKGFGLLSTQSQPDLRSVRRNKFGKKNKEEKNRRRARQLDALNEEEVDQNEAQISLFKSERISPTFDGVTFPDVQDDDLDPNYARINSFRQPPASGHSHYPPGTPTHNYSLPSVPAHSRQPPNQDVLEGLYAKVNKQRSAPLRTNSTDDRLQQIRNQLQRVRPAPSYDDLTTRRRQEYKLDSRIGGSDPRIAPRYDADRVFVSMPSRIPVEEQNQDWAGQKEPIHYSNPSYDYPGQDPHRNSCPPHSARLPVPRPAETAANRPVLPHTPSSAARAPPRYETLPQGIQRMASLDLCDEQYQDPQQKNPMIGAV